MWTDWNTGRTSAALCSHLISSSLSLSSLTLLAHVIWVSVFLARFVSVACAIELICRTASAHESLPETILDSTSETGAD